MSANTTPHTVQSIWPKVGEQVTLAEPIELFELFEDAYGIGTSNVGIVESVDMEAPYKRGVIVNFMGGRKFRFAPDELTVYAK